MNAAAPITLHVLGCGRAGRTLARLWAGAGWFRIGRIVNTSLESARQAATFIGAGQAADHPRGMQPGDPSFGDWWMLAVPDGQLAPCARALSESLTAPPALAFHISGAVAAEVLRPLGCPVAAVHPVCPFADPQAALDLVAGSHALGEGDAEALDKLLPAFDAIGAQTRRFAPSDKRLYHAATIAASNFLNVLDALALDLAAAGGVAPEVMQPVLVALQRAALASIERTDPVAALTGPIERADRRGCEALMASMQHAGSEHKALFAHLGRATLALARRKHGPDPALALLEPVFSSGEQTHGRV